MTRSLWPFAFALLPLLSIAPQAPTFRSSVEAVRVDVLVTQGGLPVTDLTPADFEVLDNGVLQQIDQASFEQVPLNLVIALDASGSVQGERARYLRSASSGLLDRLKPTEHAALLTFSDAIVMPGGLTQDFPSIRAALERPLPFGDTSLVDAGYAAILLAESRPGRPLVIVFSDGIEASSYLVPEAVLEAVKRSDAVIYGVTMKNVGRPPFLDRLVDASGGKLLEIGAARNLDEAFARVLEEFRHRYLFSYTPRGVARAGWHRVEVRVKRRGMAVKARPGYFRD
jgi:VWFA-related protein